MKSLICFIWILATSPTVNAVEANEYTFKKHSFLKVKILNKSHEEVKFFLKDDSGVIIGSYANLKSFLKSKNRELIFATNAGIYENNRKPSGLYLENAQLVSPLNMNGRGNFSIKPSGVLYIENNILEIQTLENYKENSNIKFAIQSGPILVANGEISESMKLYNRPLGYIRSAGCKKTVGEFSIILSKDPLNLLTFAEILAKNFECNFAIYLEGAISSVYYPDIKRIDSSAKLGPILGVTVPEKLVNGKSQQNN